MRKERSGEVKIIHPPPPSFKENLALGVVGHAHGFDRA